MIMIISHFPSFFIRLTVKPPMKAALLVGVPPETDPGISIQMQVDYLGGDPKKYWLGSGELRYKREGSL